MSCSTKANHKLVTGNISLVEMPPVKIRIVDENEDDMAENTVKFKDQIWNSPKVFPSHSSQGKITNKTSINKNGVTLTGVAALAKLGGSVGAVDIAESEDLFVFRVALPGVARDEKDFSCDIDPDGTVTIKGITTTGEKTVHRFSQVFTMLTQNLCPPGHFSVSFKLPSPVNTEDFIGIFGIDGMLEGLLKKSLQRSMKKCGA